MRIPEPHASDPRTSEPQTSKAKPIDPFSPTCFPDALCLAQALQFRDVTLLVGGGTFIGGLLMMFSHQRAFRETFDVPMTPRQIRFVHRKYRRRIVVAGLIASVGLMIASVRWITQPRPFASLVMIMLLTLLAIFVMAIIDMYSVGLQEMTKKDKSRQKELVDEVLRRREAIARQKSEGDETGESDTGESDAGESDAGDGVNPAAGN